MIYDCFTFFNELDLLEIRLNVLKDVVDKFVLVESDRTFTNRPKELIFEKNKARFAAFADKIIHIVVKDYPEYTSPWIYESIQRNHIADGLKDAKPDDWVLVSDIDEIPNPDKVCECAKTKGSAFVFCQRYYAYYLNYVNVRNPRWWGLKMLSYADFCHALDGVKVVYDDFLPEALNQGTTASKIRMRGLPKMRKVFNGGWHFTSLGGVAAVIEKLKSYSHQEHCNDSWRYDPVSVERMIQDGKSPGLKMNCFAVKIDASFPQYIRDNQSKYANLIFEVTPQYLKRVWMGRFFRTFQGIIIYAIERVLLSTGIHRQLHRLRVWVREWCKRLFDKDLV